MYVRGSLQGAPALLDDAAKASLDEILGILVAVKIQLAFKAKLEQSRRYLRPIGGVRGLLDKLREVFFDRAMWTFMRCL